MMGFLPALEDHKLTGYPQKFEQKKKNNQR